MKYPYRVELIQEADGERYWVARSDCLKGCIGTGETPEEAAAELEENENVWLETAKEYGAEIPAVPYESVETYSGKFTVRVSSYVHKSASEQAKKQGISLNQFVNDAIINYTAEIKTADHIAKTVIVKTQEVIKSTANSMMNSGPLTMRPYVPTPKRNTYTYDINSHPGRAIA